MTGISVVIISKNEKGLADTLDAIEPQCRELAAEIVVVDASAGALDDIAADWPDIRWIAFPPKAGKRITIPEQRNLGVHAAHGDVIVFIDCGCVPEPGWLSELVAPIVSGSEHIVAGQTMSQRSSVYSGAGDAEPPRPRYVAECATANLAFSRHAFDAVGGFDETFDYASDVDLAWRWTDAKLPIFWTPDATVRIDWGSSRRQIRRSFLWGAGRARLYLKHRGRLAGLVRQDPIAVAYPVFLLGLLPTLLIAAITPAALLYPAVILIPLWRNRKQRPLSVVGDHLVYGVGVLWQLGRQLCAR